MNIVISSRRRPDQALNSFEHRFLDNARRPVINEAWIDLPPAFLMMKIESKVENMKSIKLQMIYFQISRLVYIESGSGQLSDVIAETN